MILSVFPIPNLIAVLDLQILVKYDLKMTIIQKLKMTLFQIDLKVPAGKGTVGRATSLFPSFSLNLFNLV